MKVWDSIDSLPIYFYWKVIDTRSLEWLLEEKPDKKTPQAEVDKLLRAAWDKIEVEMYDLQLQDKDFIHNLEAERRHYLKKIKAAVSQKTIDVLHYEQSALIHEKKEKSKFDYDQSIVAIEEKIGQIDDKKMSVRRYYAHLKKLKNGK